MEKPSKVALITGVTGQDSAYPAEFLLKKSYEAHGIKRRAPLFNTDRLHAIGWRAPTPSQARLTKSDVDFLTKAAV